MGGQVLTLAWPAIIEMSLHMLVWVVDTAIVGRLGPEALGAVGLGAQVYFSSFFALGAVGIGATAVVARYTGAGRDQEAGRVAAQVLVIAVALGALLTVLGITLAGTLYQVTGLGEPTASLGQAYVRTVALGAPFVLLNLAVNGVLRGRGDTRTPLYISAAANVTNGVLDYLLVFGVGSLPALGVVGAAVASVLAQVLGGTLALVAFFRSRLALRGRWFLPDLRQIIRLARLSVPAALEIVLMDGARSLSMLFIATRGTVALAAGQVAVAAESLSFMPGYGFAIASSILVAQNLGAGSVEKAERAAGLSLRWALLIMGGMGLVFLFFPGTFVHLFVNDASVVTLGGRLLQVSGVAQPFIAATEVLTGSLRGAGDTRAAMWITALGAWGIRIPLTVIFIFVLKLPLVAVWWAITVEWAVRTLVVYVYFRRGRWHRAEV